MGIMRPKVTLFLLNLTAGGVQRVVVQLANYLQEKQYQVDVVLSTLEGEYLKLLKPGIELIGLGTSSRIRLVSRFARHLRSTRPAVVFTFFPDTSVIALISQRLSGTATKVIPGVHRSLVDASGNATYDSKALHSWFGKRLFKSAGHIIAVSNGVQKQVAQVLDIDPKRVSVIRNPLDSAVIREQAAAPTTFHWFHDPNLQVLVAFGRLIEEKDYPTLLRAFALLPDTVRLVIFGQGPLLPELEALAASLGIAERVKFMGFKRNPFSWLVLADVYVLSSRTEGFPTAMEQAFALNVPVVSTDCPTGPREMIELVGSGILVEPGNPPALAEAITRALAEPQPKPDVSMFEAGTILAQYEQLISGEQ